MFYKTVSDNKAIRVIMHDSVSLDGSFINFEFSPDLMELHYRIAAGFGDTIRLFGSGTANVAIEMFGGLSPETEEDFKKPQGRDGLSFWVLVDSGATLKDRLHFFRRLEYYRDIIVLISESTSKDYLNYLEARDYDYYVVGKKQVDLDRAIGLICSRYKKDTVMVDSGRGLTNAMLNQGLVDEISLLVLPVIVGERSEDIFGDVINPIKLRNMKAEKFPGGYVHLSYEVQK